MTQNEAIKLARDLMPRNAGQSVLVTSADLRRLCHAILSGDHKREIENAAFKTASDIVDAARDQGYVDLRTLRDRIRSLIQPPAQKEDGE